MMNENDLERKIKSENFGTFLGGFVSEGNLVDTGSLKITNQNLKFISHIIKSATNLFGDEIATSKPPTLEHNDPEQFAYHKYMSTEFGRFLINEVGIKPGKRILNDEPLPSSIYEWFKKWNNPKGFKRWIISYLQSRFSGDGWVHMSKKWIGLTKVKAVHINDSMLRAELSNLYSKGRRIRDYPKIFVEKLKKEARRDDNLPKELVQLKGILKKVLSIDPRVYSVGIKTIYHDRKRGILIISGIYHLIISKKDNVSKFRDYINFLEIDKRNRKRLTLILEKLNSGGKI